MKKIDQKTIKNILIILTVITILLGAGYFIIFSWNSPINQALSLPDESQDMTDGSDSGDMDSTDLEGSQETGTVTPTIEPVCGGPPSFSILLSGVSSNNYLYGLADAIRIVRVDFQTKKVSVLALPRDLWVEIPGLESRGIKEGKLNQAYFYGTEGMGYFEGLGYGSGLLAETLLDNFGYRADRYIAVNLNSFRMIIDALGGIDVYLADDVNIKKFEEPVLFLKAGSHHLNGKQAEQLARSRITIGDFGRINNQTVILKALAVKMLSPTGIAALPSLIDQLKSNVQTDLSPADISQLVCLARMLDYDQDIKYPTLPEDSMLEQMVYDPARGINTAALIVDKERISQLITKFQLGTMP